MYSRFQRLAVRRARLLFAGGSAWLWLLVVLTAAAVASTSGCGESAADVSRSTLRVGVVSDRDPAEQRQRHARLLNYLSSECGVACELVLLEGYAAMVNEFERGRVDLVLFGGGTFVLARQRAGAMPLVCRDVDRHFTSVFLASAKSPKRTLEEFRGAQIAFADELSTSGHLMPHFFLEQIGIEPESFFADTRFSGAHDRTIGLVLDGTVDLGTVNALYYEQMLNVGRLRPEDLRIVWESPPYMDYVWAVQPSLAAAERRRLRDAFLALSPDNPQEEAILDDQGARAFLPASSSDFDVVMGVVERFQKKHPESKWAR